MLPADCAEELPALLAPDCADPLPADPVLLAPDDRELLTEDWKLEREEADVAALDTDDRFEETPAMDDPLPFENEEKAL